MAITRKALDAFVAPHFKAAVRYANNHCVHFTPNPVPAGVVVSHGEGNPKAGEIQFEGYTIEISMCRRARVVCGVPPGPFFLIWRRYRAHSGLIHLEGMFMRGGKKHDEKSGPLAVRINTFKLNDAGNDWVLENTKVVDHAIHSDRMWLGNHCYWALRNERMIETLPEALNAVGG